jgi:hypothetical protein
VHESGMIGIKHFEETVAILATGCVLLIERHPLLFKRIIDKEQSET